LVVRGNKTNKELEEYINKIKRSYGFTDEEITIVDTMKSAASKIADDARCF